MNNSFIAFFIFLNNVFNNYVSCTPIPTCEGGSSYNYMGARTNGNGLAEFVAK